MVGIPRLALIAVAGALPFAGAVLANDARSDSQRTGDSGLAQPSRAAER